MFGRDEIMLIFDNYESVLVKGFAQGGELFVIDRVEIQAGNYGTELRQVSRLSEMQELRTDGTYVGLLTDPVLDQRRDNNLGGCVRHSVQV